MKTLHEQSREGVLCTLLLPLCSQAPHLTQKAALSVPASWLSPWQAHRQCFLQGQLPSSQPFRILIPSAAQHCLAPAYFRSNYAVVEFTGFAFSFTAKQKLYLLNSLLCICSEKMNSSAWTNRNSSNSTINKEKEKSNKLSYKVVWPIQGRMQHKFNQANNRLRCGTHTMNVQT